MNIEKYNFPRPKVIVSKCLDLENCRYDGSVISAPFVTLLSLYADLTPICPEMAIGLPSPRNSLRLVNIEGENRLIMPNTNIDYTEKMISFSHDFFSSIETQSIHGVILKSKSPSCGVNDVKVYKGERKITSKANGIFGEKVLEVFPHAIIENEGRMLNMSLREHFLTVIFMKAELDQVQSVSELVEFQTRHKYVLMGYDQKRQKALGRIVASCSKIDFENGLIHYKSVLSDALINPPKVKRMVNVFEHVYGYFKDHLNNKEKEYFMMLLQSYKENKVTIRVVVQTLFLWTIHFEEDYLMKQSLFNPFPEELISLLNSGKY